MKGSERGKELGGVKKDVVVLMFLPGHKETGMFV
jgi:hypothetical protein